MKTRLVWVTLGGLALSACAMAPEAAPKLDGTQWTLQGADKGDLATASGRAVTIAFTGDRVSGNSGCNEYSAAYSVQGDVLTIGPVGATKRGCADEPMAVERAWFATLGGPLTLTVRDDSLELRGADGSVLRFVPGAAKPE